MYCHYSVYEETEDETLAEALEHEKMILHQIANPPPRIIVRPKISIRKDIFIILGTMLTAAVLLIQTGKYLVSDEYFVLCCIIAGLIYFKLFIKKILFTMIVLYQKYAPENLRGACLFEPCCSEYMKISIEKYGAGKGVIRGIKRILRCRYPNGGIDEP